MYINKTIATLLLTCLFIGNVNAQSILNANTASETELSSIPGFNEATVGGCINSNVHGKDAHFQGVF